MRNDVRRIARTARMLAVAGLAVATAACSAKVKQDVFEETVADLRGDIASLEGRVDGNDARIAANEAAIASLRTDLETLVTEFGEIEAQIVEIEHGLQFAMPVHFEFDRADVRATDEAALDRLATVLARYYPGVLITVEGFADPAGAAAYNKRLSERRAENVAAYLTTNHGFGENDVRTVGYGEERLVTPGAQGPGLEGLENRRVTFVIEFGGELERATVASATDG